MVAVNGDQRHFGDQTQSLAEDVRNGNVIRLFVVGIQDPQYMMRSMMIGAALNVVLDPIFIFVFRWGIQGAALATIIGQIVSE